MKRKHLLVLGSLTVALFFTASLLAVEHIVQPGDDSFAQAKAALQEGDSIVFQPGEYYGGLHTELSNITLRAAIAGSVVLRADVNAPAFQAHSPRIWHCAWPEMPQAVNERDTFTIYQRVSSLNELSLTPGAWFYEAGQLYLQTSDAAAPEQHCLTITTYNDHGLLFNTAIGSNKPIRKVVIEGLILTGFNNNSLKLDDRHSRRFSNWPLLIFGAKDCVVRQTTAFLNAQGMAFNGSIPVYGGEVENSLMEDCRAFGNYSPFNVSGGGLSIYGPARNSVVRRAFTADNRPRGIGYYAGLFSDCRMEDCVSLDGQRSKTNGVDNSQLLRNISSSLSPYATPLSNCLVFGSLDGENRRDDEDLSSNILLRYEEKVDLTQEFADPDNYDFRPLPNSRFLGRGPHPQAGAVALVANRSQLEEHLQDNSTLYLLPGEWSGELILKNRKGLKIAGRGKGFRETSLQLKMENCQDITLERLSFAQLDITGGQDIKIKQCFGILNASQVSDLRLRHNFLAQANILSCPKAFVTACIFGQKVQDGGWSDYNAYSQTIPADEPHSFLGVPELSPGLSFANAELFQGRASDGFPVGPYQRQLRNTQLQVDGPRLVAQTATTANIELIANLPVAGVLKYGDTPECNEVINFATAAHHNIGLSGLKPGSELFFRVELQGKILEQFSNQTLANTSPSRQMNSEVQKITQPLTNRPPQTYFVSTQGDDAADGINTPWRSISQAAKLALAGDSVIIAGGVYQESVLLRTTGDLNRPITFRGKEGEKVLLCGDNRRINDGIVLTNQKHLVFDNLYFQGFCLTGMRIADAANIYLSRCFWDARRHSFTRALQAHNTSDLTVDNCIRLGGHEGVEVYDCPNFTLKNSVMFYGGVTSLRVFNDGLKTSICNNLFTDNLLMKGRNPVLFVLDLDGLQEENNCFFLRLPATEKPVIGYNILGGQQLPAMGSSSFLGAQQMPYPEYLKATGRQTKAIFANPQVKFMPEFQSTYSTLAEWAENWQKSRGSEYKAESEISFADFFAQNPELLERSIGLQPERFEMTE